ncbi:MAG: LamG-like jellyroll fold domain-containing protein [Planctomycetota bacterium]
MNRDDTETLIDKVLDGAATEAEQRQLESLLAADVDLRAAYVAACRQRVLLSEELRDSDAKPLPTELTTPIPRRRYGTRRALAVVASLAACFALAWLGLQLARSNPDGELAGNQGEEIETPPEPAVVANDAIGRIIRKIDCVLNDEAWALGSTAEVAAGQTFSLERGFMSLRLKNGVTVLLRGPAEFTAVDELHGMLRFGGVGVRVPDGFSGYIVETPSARVTDLGTEFSVVVNEEGVTDLQVLDGEVTVSQRDASGDVAEGEPEVLTKDAVWNSVAGIKRPKGPPSPTDFPSVSLLEDPDYRKVNPLPVQDDLSMWLRADRALRLDSQKRVVVWGDISTKESASRHSAWQVQPRRRPTYVRRGVGGRPSIRFDGVDDCLITEPFYTGQEQTVVVVAKLRALKSRNTSIPAQQFLNYNGPPHLVLEYRWPVEQLRARAFAGYEAERQASGWIVARPIEKGETLSMVYRYSHHNNQATLYLNGEEQGNAEAVLPISSARPKVIGCHRQLWGGALMGNVAEVIIFDRALSDDEISELNAYLARRYPETPAS